MKKFSNIPGYKIQKVLGEEMRNLKLDSLELNVYYQAHKSKYTKEVKDQTGKTAVIPRSFAEVRSEVLQDYGREKQGRIYQNLMERLLKAEDVKLFPVER